MIIRLLADENISWRIKKLLHHPFEILPVNEILSPQPIKDLIIWKYAKVNDFTILTFDEDFVDIQLLRGYPPKLIWLRLGNVSVVEIANRLQDLQPIITDFISDSETGVLEVYP